MVTQKRQERFNHYLEIDKLNKNTEYKGTRIYIDGLKSTIDDKKRKEIINSKKEYKKAHNFTYIQFIIGYLGILIAFVVLTTFIDYPIYNYIVNGVFEVKYYFYFILALPLCYGIRYLWRKKCDKIDKYFPAIFDDNWDTFNYSDDLKQMISDTNELQAQLDAITQSGGGTDD